MDTTLEGACVALTPSCSKFDHFEGVTFSILGAPPPNAYTLALKHTRTMHNNGFSLNSSIKLAHKYNLSRPLYILLVPSTVCSAMHEG